MSIDLTLEPPIPLREVPQLAWIPKRRRGRRIHVATIHRWCAHGIRGRRLEYVQVGGTRVTTEAALHRFFASLTEPPQPTPTTHLKASDDIQRALAGYGF